MIVILEIIALLVVILSINHGLKIKNFSIIPSHSRVSKKCINRRQSLLQKQELIMTEV